MEYLTDRLTEPRDCSKVFPWNRLSRKSQNTLHRAIERSDVWTTSEFSGFSFDLLKKISIRDLSDARFIGPARAEELIQELISLFKGSNFKKDLDSAAVATAHVISISSPEILAKLTVEEDLYKYLERFCSVETMTSKRRNSILRELIPREQSFQGMIFESRDQETLLGLLIDANLRQSFAVAKSVSTDRDLRARTIAGNLGMLAGITTFFGEPNLSFKSHLKKCSRKFIQDLVGSFNLSYDDIVELMLGEHVGKFAPFEDAKEIQPVVAFQNCATFSELFEELDRELLKLPKIDERALAMLKHRHHAFGEPGATLDEIGKEWGVTRERVRQIVDPLMEVRIEVEPQVPILLRAVELFEHCVDEEQFNAVVRKDSIFAGVEITWERLWGIALIFSPDVLGQRIYEKHEEFDVGFDIDSTIRGSIKKDRSKFGLYDLQVVSKKYEINEDTAFKVISEIYPRSIRVGNLVLARTMRVDTMFENSIVKQLKVCSPIEVEELLKGLQRTGKQRDASLLGSRIDLTNLIHELAGDPPSYQKAASDLRKEFEFQTLEKWLIEIFSDANLGILHSNDVVSLALRDRRINVSSASVYLLNSPIIRSQGKSLYSLVGTKVTEDQLDDYLQIFRGSSEASEVSYEMLGASKGMLRVKPNLNVITSGIVFPPAGYKKIFEGFEFKTSCLCGGLKTTQAVKYTSSGFWTGFTAMIRHGFSQHQMTRGSTFHFEFDFDNFAVVLLAN
jgi:hypothetical protein